MPDQLVPQWVVNEDMMEQPAWLGRKPELYTKVYLAADVEAVEAERDAYKAQCECRYCKGHHFNISVCSKCAFSGKDAPHFIQQAHALAAKDIEIERLKGHLHLDNPDSLCNQIVSLQTQLAAKEACLRDFPGHHNETAYNLWLNRRDEVLHGHR